MRIKRLVIIIIAVIAAVLIAFYAIGVLRQYSDFTVISESAETNGDYSSYETFCGNLLVYGGDGITCLDVDGNPLWSQSYEIDQPIFDMCGSYVVVAQTDGNRVYLFNEEGYLNRLDAPDRIVMAAVSSEGTIALVMEASDGCVLQIIDDEGETVAEGHIYTQNSGYPLGMDISYDGSLMAVSCLTLSSGSVKTTVNFYSFDDGDYSDSAVSFEYDNIACPEVSFLDKDSCVVAGDAGACFFDTSGKDPKQEDEVLSFNDKAASVFEGDGKFGVIFKNDEAQYESSDAASPRSHVYRVDIYSSSGKFEYEKGFDLDYKSVSFLDNGELCILSKTSALIYSRSGREKFSYNFDEDIRWIISLGNLNNYAFIYSDRAQRVRFK